MDMAQQWIIRVQGKEYGPADLETLLEWKREGRLLAQNPARPEDVDLWKTAAEIPGLFTTEKVIAAAADHEAQRPPAARRSFFQIVAATLRIYRQGFFQFLALTLFTALPSIAGQITSGFVQTSSGTPVDLRTLLAGAFSFCMLVLTLVLWPIYIAGVQVLSAELLAGRRIGFVATLNQAIKYWPRVGGGCVFVYGVFFLLLSFGFAILLIVAFGATSLPLIFTSLLLLALQVWMFGRFFINVLFWQQFVVLENHGVLDALRESKNLARSGHDLPWYRRPLWRGAFIFSMWTAFVLAIAVVSQWPALQQYWKDFSSIHDLKLLLEKMQAASEHGGVQWSAAALSLGQRVLQPLLGIAFVVLYFDSRVD
jgi:hypothetical protein